MRKILLACLFVGFALNGFAQDNHLVKILVSGTHRYQPEDVIRATGLKENSVVTTAQLEAGTKRLGDSGAFTSVQYNFRPAPKTWGVEAEFQVKDADKFLPAESKMLCGGVTRSCNASSMMPFLFSRVRSRSAAHWRMTSPQPSANYLLQRVWTAKLCGSNGPLRAKYLLSIGSE
ncbi:MAG TPA: POTRA domain-containing protein [Candidatus Angelobacter sp.]|nr:POTRA domain-containing protein [Candidatus Angelobacter sp.]